MAFYVKKHQTDFVLKSLTQPKGVGATGAVTIVNNPLLPVHDFFTPGRVFPVRIRHSNLVKNDDAALDVRVVSLKFSDSDIESPFDLVMHTGEEAAVWNILSFDKMMNALNKGGKTFEEYCREHPWQ